MTSPTRQALTEAIHWALVCCECRADTQRLAESIVRKLDEHFLSEADGAKKTSGPHDCEPCSWNRTKARATYVCHGEGDGDGEYFCDAHLPQHKHPTCKPQRVPEGADSPKDSSSAKGDEELGRIACHTRADDTIAKDARERESLRSDLARLTRELEVANARIASLLTPTRAYRCIQCSESITAPGYCPECAHEPGPYSDEDDEDDAAASPAKERSDG